MTIRYRQHDPGSLDMTDRIARDRVHDSNTARSSPLTTKPDEGMTHHHKPSRKPIDDARH